MRLYLLPYFVFLLFACDQPNGGDKISNKNPGGDEKMDTIIKYTYKSNSEIEELIEKQSHRFLSYFWYGMSENQTLEVLRYLIDQGTVDAFLRKGDVENSLISKNIKSVKVKNQKVGYSFLTDSPRVMYDIQGKESTIKFEVGFDFGLEYDSLRSLSLIAAPWSNTNGNISLENYNYLVDFFSEKYGKIVDKTSQPWAITPELLGEPVEYRRCRFLKNGVSVELEYSSRNSTDGSLLQQLAIYYMLYLDDKFSTYDSERKRFEKNKKEIEQEVTNRKRKKHLGDI